MFVYRLIHRETASGTRERHERRRASYARLMTTNVPRFQTHAAMREAALRGAEFVEQHVHVPEGFEP
jgi:hypothetical protein